MIPWQGGREDGSMIFVFKKYLDQIDFKLTTTFTYTGRPR